MSKDLAPSDEEQQPGPSPGFDQITRALARVEEGRLKAFSDDDRVLIMIQDAPEELRRMAAALEKLNIREVQALIAYENPADTDDTDDTDD